MKTNKYTHVRYFIFVCFLFSLVILTACKPNASASKPFPDLKEWDLLIISDSMNWGVGQNYAKLIESDMNVKVNLHDCWVGGLSIGAVLDALQSGGTLYPYVDDQSCYKPLPDLVKEAEVMVLFGNPLDSYPPDGSWNIPEDHNACVMGGYEGKNLLPGFETYKDKMLKSCAPETWATYKAHLGTVLDEIGKIREGRPLILRMTDAYIPVHSNWDFYGVDEVCTTCLGYLSEAIRQVAEEHGVPVADTMVGLNGKDYMSEIPAGYLRDGIHPSGPGAQFIATLLQKTGYEYAGK
jgi:hypothetical protein